MSLPKTIWWCSVHGSGQDYWAHIVPTCGAYKAGWSDPCVWTTLSVAGRGDLVIRREDIDYEAAKRAAFEVAEQIAQARYEGQRFSLTEVNDLKVRAAVDAALAAAKGGEE